MASALLDIDNIVQRQLHEQISIDDSREMLFELKYDEAMISGIASCNKSTEIDYSKGCPKRKVHSRGAKIVSDADLSNPGFFDVTNFAFESIKLWLEVGKLDFTEFVVKGAEFTHCLFNSIGDYYTGAARFSFPKNRKQNMANLQTEIERIMRLCNGDVNRLKAMLLEDDKRLMTLSGA